MDNTIHSLFCRIQDGLGDISLDGYRVVSRFEVGNSRFLIGVFKRKEEAENLANETKDYKGSDNISFSLIRYITDEKEEYGIKLALGSHSIEDHSRLYDIKPRIFEIQEEDFVYL